MTNNLEAGKVLVTGADGFIGSHLVDALLEMNISVRALAHYNSFGHSGWLDTFPADKRRSVEIVHGDIRDQGCVSSAMQGIHTVFHLAALIAIPYSYRAAESYIDTNVKGTLNVLEAARRLGTRRIVHTSTSEVYGTAQQVPIPETHPLNPQSPYAASKAAADHLALSYQKSFDLPVAVVRPFNTFGPRQSARAVIPTVITQIANGANRVQLGALTPTRDFSYVGDTCQGFIAVAESDRTVGRVVNLGSGFEISIAETAALIAEVMGKDIVVEADPNRLRPEASEVERLFSDASLVGELTGWRPTHGGKDGFRIGLEKTARWFLDPKNLEWYPDGYQI